MRYIMLAVVGALTTGCVPYYGMSPQSAAHATAHVQAWVWIGYYDSRLHRQSGHWEVQWVDPRMVAAHPHRYAKYSGRHAHPPTHPAKRPRHRPRR